MSTQVLVVDDHQIVREGVRSLLKAQRPGWAVVEAQNGDEALESIRANNPDIVIMDITLPGTSGLEVVSGLRKSGFRRPVLIFTMHKSDQLENETRGAGAQGYVLKSQAVEDLVRAMDTLLANGTFFGAPPSPGAVPDKPKPSAMFRLRLIPAIC